MGTLFTTLGKSMACVQNCGAIKHDDYVTLCISPNFRCQPRIVKHFFCMARSSHKQAPLQPSSPSSPLSFHSLGTKRVSFGKANQSSRDRIAQLLERHHQDITSKVLVGNCTSSDVLPTVDFQTMDKNQSTLW